MKDDYARGWQVCVLTILIILLLMLGLAKVHNHLDQLPVCTQR